MGIAYENSLKVNINNPVVVDYIKNDKPHTMPDMHIHPYCEVFILISGERKYFFHNRIIELQPHDILIIKPNDAHRVISTSGVLYERYVLNIDPSVCFQIEKYNEDIKKLFKKEIFHLDDSAFVRLQSFVKSLENETKKSEEYRYSVRNYLERIFIELSLYGDSIVKKNRFKKNDTRLETALDYIGTNFNQNISIEKCAKISCMSKSNFARIFHEVVGVNFKEYINSLRVKKACELLCETDLSVSAVSDEVGFESLSYFCYVFKNHINMSPKDYKTRYSSFNL